MIDPPKDYPRTFAGVDLLLEAFAALEAVQEATGQTLAETLADTASEDIDLDDVATLLERIDAWAKS